MNNKKFYKLLAANLFMIFLSFVLLTRHTDSRNYYFDQIETILGVFLWIPIILLSIYQYRDATPEK